MRRAGLTTVRATPNPGGYTPIWPPTKLPGCVAWLDMQETFTEVGGVVQHILNMASGVDWIELVNSPTYTVTGINGIPCMAGNQTAMRIVSSESAVVNTFLGATPRFTLFLVVSPITAPPTAAPLCYFGVGNSLVSSSNTMRFMRAGGALSVRAERIDDNGLSTSLVSRVPEISRPLVVCYRSWGTTTDLIIDNELRSGPLGIGITTPDQAALLCRPDSVPDSFCSDMLGAALVFDTALPIDAIRGLTAALGGRWGIPA